MHTTASCRHRHHSPHHHKLFLVHRPCCPRLLVHCAEIRRTVKQHITTLLNIVFFFFSTDLVPRQRTQQLESKSKYTGHLGMCCLNVTPACDNNRWLASYAGSGRVPPFVGVCSADESEDEEGDFVLRLSS